MTSGSPPRPEINALSPHELETKINALLPRGHDEYTIPRNKSLLQRLKARISGSPNYNPNSVLRAKYLLQRLQQEKINTDEREKEIRERPYNELLRVTHNTIPPTKDEIDREHQLALQSYADSQRKQKEKSDLLAQRKKLGIPNSPITKERIAALQREEQDSKGDLMYSTNPNPHFIDRLKSHHMLTDKVNSTIRKFYNQPKDAHKWGNINSNVREEIEGEGWPSFFRFPKKGGKSRRYKQSKRSRKHSRKTRRH